MSRVVVLTHLYLGKPQKQLFISICYLTKISPKISPYFLLGGQMFPTSQASVPPPPTDNPQSAPGLASRTCFLRRSANIKSKTQQSGNYQQNFANYQNCTIVRSHMPHANYGTYVKVTPKILIFPIFVQVNLPYLQNKYKHYIKQTTEI